MNVLGTDPRALCTDRIVPPAPLPHVSRRRLARVRDHIAPSEHCHVCQAPAVLSSNAAIYNGNEYGDWPYCYRCTSCDAYVGLHPHTDLPLGTMVGKEGREARKKAKNEFLDSRLMSAFRFDRDYAYAWLAEALGIPRSHCHFGMFTIEQCEAASAAVARLKAERASSKRRPN